MPLTNLGFDDIPNEQAMDLPRDDQFGEASLWLHSAGCMAHLAVVVGDERMKLMALKELRRACTALGFELTISSVTQQR